VVDFLLVFDHYQVDLLVFHYILPSFRFTRSRS
jgi:hypothetical protein